MTTDIFRLKQEQAVKGVAEVKMRRRISFMRCCFEKNTQPNAKNDIKNVDFALKTSNLELFVHFLPLSLAFFVFMLYFCRNSTKTMV